MTGSEDYLRELRRALPIGYRRRLVAEVREHFASAIATEAERGLGTAEAERLTIERLGPADALAAQLLADLRSGALGRIGRIKAAVTTGRVVACAGLVAVGTGVTAVVAVTHTSPARPAPRQTATSRPTVRIDPRTGEVRAVMVTLQTALREHHVSRTWVVTPKTYYLSPAPPAK